MLQREPIEARYRELLQAWNRRDADAFASLFTHDGHAVAFDGSEMIGRAEIASTLSAVFQNERTGTYVATVRGIRDIARGVVLLRAIVGMIPPDIVDLNLRINLSVHAVQSVVFVQQDDKLKVALLQSTPASLRGRPEVAESLMQELEEVLRSRGVEH